MNPSGYRVALCTLTAALFLAGCGIDVKQAYPDRRFYDLHAVRSGAPRQPIAGSIARVRRLKVSPRCEGSEIVTRTGEATYESDFYNVFFAPPAAMVTEEARRWLAASSLFGHVVDSGSHAVATHVVEGSVAALHGDVRNPADAKAVLEMQFFLLDDRTAPPSVLLRKEYRREVAVGPGSPANLVRGWAEGLTAILAQFENDLAQLK